MIFFKSSVWIALVVASFSSCSDFQKMTLQRYFIQKMEQPEFMIVDVPLISLGDYFNQLEPEEKEIVNTVKKFNMLVYKGNTEEMLSEINTISDILESDDYQSLMTLRSDGLNIDVMVDSNEDSYNEGLVYFYDEEKFVVLIRVLGKKMELDRLLPIASKLNSQALEDAIDNQSNQNVVNIFKGIIDYLESENDSYIEISNPI